MIDSKQSDLKVKPAAVADTKTAGMPQKTESRQEQVSANAATGSGDLRSGEEPTQEEVAALAYQFWIERGSPHGSHDEDWYRAEQELRGVQAKTRTAGA